MRFLQSILFLSLSALTLSGIPASAASYRDVKVDVSVAVAVSSSAQHHAVSDKFRSTFEPLIAEANSIDEGLEEPVDEDQDEESEFNDALNRGKTGKQKPPAKKNGGSKSSTPAPIVDPASGDDPEDLTASFLNSSGQPCPESEAVEVMVPTGLEKGTFNIFTIDIYRSLLAPNPSPQDAALRARAQPIDRNFSPTTAEKAVYFIVPTRRGTLITVPAPFFRKNNGIAGPTDVQDDDDDDREVIPQPDLEVIEEDKNDEEENKREPEPVRKPDGQTRPRPRPPAPAPAPAPVPDPRSSAIPWLVRARRDLGVREIRGSRHNPRVVAYWDASKIPLPASLKTDETPWCAAFVGAILERSGIRSTRSGMALSYRRWGTRLSGPAVGAVAVFNRGNGLGHVGFVVGKSNRGRLLVLGGNQANMVKVSEFLRSRQVTFHWPSGSPAPPAGWNRLPVLRSDGQISVNEQ